MSKPQIEPRWSDEARFLRAMAHPVRLMVLEALCERPKCVKDLNSLIPIVQPHLSQHIAALRKAELIDCHVVGALRCYYVIRPTLVKKLMRLLSQDHPVQPRDCASVAREASRTGPSRSSRGSGRKSRKARASPVPG